MHPGTRACYGASAVGIFAGLMMVAAGAIIILETTYMDGQVAHVIWMLVSFMCVTGFCILLLSLLFCSCAFCMHASADSSVYPGDDDEEIGKKPNGWASPPMPVPNGHPAWTGGEENQNGWVMPESPDAVELEDLDAVTGVLEEEDLLAEELAKEAEEELPPVEAEDAPEEPEPEVLVVDDGGEEEKDDEEAGEEDEKDEERAKKGVEETFSES